MELPLGRIHDWNPLIFVPKGVQFIIGEIWDWDVGKCRCRVIKRGRKWLQQRHSASVQQFFAARQVVADLNSGVQLAPVDRPMQMDQVDLRDAALMTAEDTGLAKIRPEISGL
ncbi:hypothetical protein M770_32895 (plasmid) [Pseudomonas aeruginosa VRFPA03]|nr:hypothetical protein M770_32895 [Pseudomonas aeruginosa VRFPA03]